MSFASTVPLPTAGVPFSLPIACPDPLATPPAARAPLSPEQETKLANLTAHFNEQHFTLPTTVKALKNGWRIAQGGSTRSFGNFFRAAPVDTEVRQLRRDVARAPGDAG